MGKRKQSKRVMNKKLNAAKKKSAVRMPMMKIPVPIFNTETKESV